MPRKKIEKVRLNLDLPPKVKVRLEELRAMTDADSMSEVVRRALALYDLVVASGGKVVIKDGDTEEVIRVI